MMGQPVRRKLWAPVLALLVIGATLAPPLLDAAEGPRATQIESEHDPATCAVLHDHTACTQLAKLFGRLVRGWTLDRQPLTTRRDGLLPRTATPPLRTFSPSPSPRGPPHLFS